MGSDTRRTSISLPQDLLEKGQRIAKARRRNFSNYIADLIASDTGDLPASSRKMAEKVQGDGSGNGDGEA